MAQAVAEKMTAAATQGRWGSQDTTRFSWIRAARQRGRERTEVARSMAMAQTGRDTGVRV